MDKVRLKKSDAIKFFGGTQIDVAEALGIAQSSVSDWPELLSVAVSDRVRGAAVRLGKKVPRDWKVEDAA